ncbi:MAG: hypothetical protein Q8882_05155 [Bacillota bacterium]|nr:hypothetical protein [Bacillota bacterium]
MKKGLKTLINNEIFLFWITIAGTLLGGIILNMIITYKFFPEFRLYFISDYIGIQIISMLILTFLLSIILKLIGFNKVKGFWIRLLLSILAPIFIGFLQAIIFGNDRIMMLMIDLPDVVDALITAISLEIAIIIGLIFIKPWERIINFVIGILYVPIMHIAYLFILLLTSGIVYDNWL